MFLSAASSFYNVKANASHCDHFKLRPVEAEIAAARHNSCNVVTLKINVFFSTVQAEDAAGVEDGGGPASQWDEKVAISLMQHLLNTSRMFDFFSQLRCRSLNRLDVERP